jgi:tetratricopeptide (TPR) repeat protein
MEFVTTKTGLHERTEGDRLSGRPYANDLPITTLAEDRITFPVEGAAHEVVNPPRQVPDWERWNDYGIGLLLKGTAELRQAAEAFAEVEKLGRCDGPLNLARVYYAEGRLDDAVDAIRRAADYEKPAAPTWTLQWLSGLVNRQQGHLDQAERNFRSVLEDRSQEMIQRDFDFSLDYEVLNLLGETLFDRAKRYRGQTRAAERTTLLEEAVQSFQKTLAIDSENVTAHYNLSLLYAQLGRQEEAVTRAELHAKYKPDDNARDRAVRLARQRYPAANHAAEKVVIYSLHRAEQSDSEMQGDSAP